MIARARSAAVTTLETGKGTIDGQMAGVGKNPEQK